MIEGIKETNSVVETSSNGTINLGHIAEAAFKAGCIYVRNAMAKQEHS